MVTDIKGFFQTWKMIIRNRILHPIDRGFSRKPFPYNEILSFKGQENPFEDFNRPERELLLPVLITAHNPGTSVNEIPGIHRGQLFMKAMQNNSLMQAYIHRKGRKNLKGWFME
jgi:hypothetical protein